MKQQVIHVTALKSKRPNTFSESSGQHAFGYGRRGNGNGSGKKRYNAGYTHQHHSGRSK